MCASPTAAHAPSAVSMPCTSLGTRHLTGLLQKPVGFTGRGNALNTSLALTALVDSSYRAFHKAPWKVKLCPQANSQQPSRWAHRQAGSIKPQSIPACLPRMTQEATLNAFIRLLSDRLDKMGSEIRSDFREGTRPSSCTWQTQR